MIWGSILTTDWLTFPNFGQSENYCKKQKTAFRLAAETDTPAACAPQIIFHAPVRREDALATQ